MNLIQSVFRVLTFEFNSVSINYFYLSIYHHYLTLKLLNIIFRIFVLFAPKDPFSSVLCPVSWEADLSRLHGQTPLPSGFQILLAQRRDWSRKEGKSEGCQWLSCSYLHPLPEAIPAVQCDTDSRLCLLAPLGLGLIVFWVLSFFLIIFPCPHSGK